jgi:hypothetical protein
MKKIFTLVLAMGIISFSFAQSGEHRQQIQNGDNGYQQTQNNSNRQGYSYSNNNTYSSDRQYNKDNAYAYNNDRDRRDGDRDNRDRNSYVPQYNYQRIDRDDYVQPRFPLLQIVLGIGRR